MGSEGSVLLPPGEGGPKGRMRDVLPALRATLSVVVAAVFLMSGCATQKPAPPTHLLPMSYFHASSALAAADFSRAREFLRALASETTGDLKARAESAAATPDLEAMR